MTDYWTADLHIDHNNIRVYCPGRAERWNTTEEMTQGLIDGWNSVVGEHDRVFVLGDLCMGKISESLPRIAELNGQIHLWCGNHDRPWIGHSEKKRLGWKEKYEAASPGSITVHPENYGEYWYDESHGVQFNHFPFTGDSHDEDRYQEHRPKDKGQWLLHGHVHDAWKVNGRMINVGVDVWDYKPVAFETLLELMY